MQRGRIPRPTKLKVIDGNPGRRPLNKNEPQPHVSPLVPPPPKFLNTDGREEWARIAPELHALGLLTDVDLAVLAAYCHAFARWRQAETAIAEMGKADMLTGSLMIRTAKGNPIQNPLVGTANKAMEAMVRYAAEFGMTPAARSRIERGIDGNAGDPLERLLG